MINFIFRMQINIKVFDKLIWSFWIWVARQKRNKDRILEIDDFSELLLASTQNIVFAYVSGYAFKKC